MVYKFVFEAEANTLPVRVQVELIINLQLIKPGDVIWA